MPRNLIKPRLSAEVQYFRLPRKRWEKTLDQLIDLAASGIEQITAEQLKATALRNG